MATVVVGLGLGALAWLADLVGVAALAGLIDYGFLWALGALGVGSRLVAAAPPCTGRERWRWRR